MVWLCSRSVRAMLHYVMHCKVVAHGVQPLVHALSLSAPLVFFGCKWFGRARLAHTAHSAKIKFGMIRQLARICVRPDHARTIGLKE